MHRTQQIIGVGLCTLVGALVSYGLATAFTFGPFFFLAAVAYAALGLYLRRKAPPPFPAVFIGAALPLLSIAWLNRHGPGRLCQEMSDGIECLDQTSPWPIAGIAVVLIALGVGLLVLRPQNRTTSTRQEACRCDRDRRSLTL